jgi:hypothetical protein
MEVEVRCFFGCVGCTVFTTCLQSKPNADTKTATFAKTIGRRKKGYFTTSSILKILKPAIPPIHPKQLYAEILSTTNQQHIANAKHQKQRASSPDALMMSIGSTPLSNCLKLNTKKGKRE